MLLASTFQNLRKVAFENILSIYNIAGKSKQLFPYWELILIKSS
jgi:hypothetical protein